MKNKTFLNLNTWERITAYDMGKWLFEERIKEINEEEGTNYTIYDIADDEDILETGLNALIDNDKYKEV